MFSLQEDDEDLLNLLGLVLPNHMIIPPDGANNHNSLHYDLEQCSLSSDSDLDMSDILPLDETTSDDEMSIPEQTTTDPSILLGFHRHHPQPFITRHTPAWIGRDDDPLKIKEICRDLFRMGDCANDFSILAVDQKIAACHQKIKKEDRAFQKQILEIPALHLLKHKIVNICSSYKEAGILHILKYMRDDDTQEEWGRLVSIDNIKKATRMIRRCAIGFAIAFQVAFIKSLPDDEASSLLDELCDTQVGVCSLASDWHDKFESFIKDGCKQNATFSLHHDMMLHAFEVVGIALAERIGGPTGYHLLTACAKGSLAQSFVNGATSYAGFMAELLHGHRSAPPLIQSLKMDYFSVPYEGSGVNYGLDAVREEDHRKCKRLFRPGGNISAVTKRMQVMDSLHDISEKRDECLISGSKKSDKNDCANWHITPSDIKYITRAVSVIVRCGGLLKNKDDVPYNVYTPQKNSLSTSLLDILSRSCGEYLLLKYCYEEKLCGIDVECVDSARIGLEGPKELVKKVLSSKSRTVSRNKCKPPISKSSADSEEEKRRKKLKEDKSRLDGLYSQQNMCQALVNADCGKYKVAKSVGIPNALKAIVGICCKHPNLTMHDLEEIIGTSKLNLTELGSQLKASKLMHSRLYRLPSGMSTNIKVVTVENAGMPYKVRKSVSGDDYVRFIDQRVLKPILTEFPDLKTIIMCEEKYSFTPNLIKGATRAQRGKHTELSIDHLKSSKEMVSDTMISKSDITSTAQGKRLISTFIPRNVSKLSLRAECEIIFDSEFYIKECNCDESVCTCDIYTTALKCVFSDNGLVSTSKETHIKQRKGEAEMAQIDWLLSLQDCLSPGDAVMSNCHIS